MSMFPAGYDLRSEIIGALDLVEIDAVSGLARFMIGQDGRFTDTSGRVWYGAQVIGCTGYDWSRGDAAEDGALTLSYFQDPAAVSLIDQLRESGDLDVAGRAVRFYVQPIRSVADFYAPTLPPVLTATRAARSVTYAAEGDTMRRLTLSYEGVMQHRRRMRGFYWTVRDHNRLLGSPDPENPSLEYVPVDARPEEPLFG